MDFFTHQDAARKRTTLLLFYYAVAVALLVLATYAVAMFAFGARRHAQGDTQFALWNFQIFAASALGTLGVVSLGSLWRVMELRQGGSAVAEMLGGRKVPLDPDNDRERMLRNVIEEMALASGVPVPEIYLLENEAGINAFAAGHSGDDMAIGVTRGCIEQLTRDELQGVIGHEFSHILNGDARMNIRLMGVLHGILCLYIIGRILLQFRSRDSRDKNPLPLFGLALMAIGGIGLLFGRLIQAAVSRQREFLADASAVQFTRNSNGIAGALKKIGGLGSKINDPQADAASHIFFANGLAESWFGLTATHPPLEERIRRIDPSFDGHLPTAEELHGEDEVEESFASAAVPPPLSNFTAGARASRPPPIRADSVTARVGQSVPIQYAAGVLDAVPDALRDSTRDSFGAAALIFATLLSNDETVRQKQLAMLQAAGPELAGEAEHLGVELAQCDRNARLPLVSLALPALRTLSREQWAYIAPIIERLIAADGQIDLFEFALRRIVTRRMEAQFDPHAGGVIQYYSFPPLAGDCAQLLSALANIGSGDARTVQAAYEDGFSRLPFAATPPLVPRSACGVLEIDAVLTRLSLIIQNISVWNKKTLEAIFLCNNY